MFSFRPIIQYTALAVYAAVSWGGPFLHGQLHASGLHGCGHAHALAHDECSSAAGGHPGHGHLECATQPHAATATQPHAATATQAHAATATQAQPSADGLCIGQQQSAHPKYCAWCDYYSGAQALPKAGPPSIVDALCCRLENGQSAQQVVLFAQVYAARAPPTAGGICCTA